jgi:putative ABC transport system permease protein
VRHALVVVEMALSLILLVGAGLLIRTFGNLLHTDPGFDPSRLVSAEIWLNGARYDSTSSIAGYFRTLQERVAALPGVQSVSVVEAGLPLQRGGNLAVTIDGVMPRVAWTDYRAVTPEYFGTLGLTAREGRTFGPADVQGGAPVMVVSERFAHEYFPGGSPVGHMVKLGGSTDVPRLVVGVVGDVRSFIGNEGNRTAYLPAAQTPEPFTRLFGSWFPTHVMVRTSGDPATVQAALARVIGEVDPQVAVGRVRTMDEVLEGSLAFQRFVMLLLTVFAGLAIVLASVGIYGVIAFLVAQRTREIGVRMALGARSADVLRMVLRRGMILAGLGAALGLAGAFALTRLLGGLLYDVRPNDLATYAVVTTGLVVVALLACYVPARRAARTDPIIALRQEM